MKRYKSFGCSYSKPAPASGCRAVFSLLVSVLFGLAMGIIILMILNSSAGASNFGKSTGIERVFAIAGSNNSFEVYCSQTNTYITGVKRIQHNKAYYQDEQVSLSRDCIYYNVPNQ